MTERVFKTLKEVKETYFPNRSLKELDGQKPLKQEVQPIKPDKSPVPQQPTKTTA